MELYVAFLLEHWMLSGAFLVLLILFAINEWRYRALGLKGVTPQELVGLLNHAHAVVVDTRPPEAFGEGHILGAINIPQADFAKRINVLTKYKMKPVILVCAKGIDSPKLGTLLTSNGFSKLNYLIGGNEAWRSSGAPLVKR